MESFFAAKLNDYHLIVASILHLDRKYVYPWIDIKSSLGYYSSTSGISKTRLVEIKCNISSTRNIEVYDGCFCN